MKMNKNVTETLENVNYCFEDQYKLLSKGDESNVLMAHHGEFSQDLVNSLSEGLESLMLECNIKKTVVKRVFSIIIEGLQNIRLHGTKDHWEEQNGHVIVAEDDGGFNVSFGNYVAKDTISDLIVHLNKINTLNKDEIKQLYIDVLGNGFISEKGGAGLGFITIAMKSKSTLNFGFEEVSAETSYFYYNVKVASK